MKYRFPSGCNQKSKGLRIKYPNLIISVIIGFKGFHQLSHCSWCILKPSIGTKELSNLQMRDTKSLIELAVAWVDLVDFGLWALRAWRAGKATGLLTKILNILNIDTFAETKTHWFQVAFPSDIFLKTSLTNSSTRSWWPAVAALDLSKWEGVEPIHECSFSSASFFKWYSISPEHYTCFFPPIFVRSPGTTMSSFKPLTFPCSHRGQVGNETSPKTS